MTPEFVSFGNIFIDDIVLPDGRTFMGILGGAGTHALAGMRVWSEQVGFVATAGEDFDAGYQAQLIQMGVDLRGIKIVKGIPTTRAWQLFEPPDRRVEVFRTNPDDFIKFAPDFQDIPTHYYAAKGFHVYWGKAISRLPQFVKQLRAVSPSACLVWEPAFHHEHCGRDELAAILIQVELFSPDQDAAATMTGHELPEDIVEAFLSWGAPLVALRMGAAGSLLGSGDGRMWRVPAVPTTVVDVTGAGNAYCGGFLVALAAGHSPLEAALRAAVSASFEIEQFGMPTFGSDLMEQAEVRLRRLRDRVEAAG
jgi:sugar/nucleoside kinase (ribokinase family)